MLYDEKKKEAGTLSIGYTIVSQNVIAAEGYSTGDSMVNGKSIKGWGFQKFMSSAENF